MCSTSGVPLLVGVTTCESTVLQHAKFPASERPFDLLELRLDLFPAPISAHLIEACRVLNQSGTPVIATVRRRTEGGAFQGSEDARFALLERTASFVAWLDVEIRAEIAPEVAACARARNASLLASFHDFEGTPSLHALLAMAERGRRLGARICKLATRVCSAADFDTLASLCAHATDLAVIPMGDAVPAARLELARRGSALAYGYLDVPNAPGQRSAAEMRAYLRATGRAHAARRGGPLPLPYSSKEA